jgi:parvulin-like peptidyl-prolyl isomerase
MRTRRSIALFAAAAMLALGGIATVAAASPAKGPGTGSDAANAQRCERFGHAIDALELSATRLEKRIARVKERIAAAQLSPERLAKAQAFVARLEQRLAKREALVDRLQAKFAEKCA